MQRMSASDAKNRWGDLVKTVVDQGDTVIVESRREPLVVVISPAAYDEFQTLRRAQLLREVRASLQEIERIQAGRNDDISDEEIEEIGIRTAREIRDDLDHALHDATVQSQ